MNYNNLFSPIAEYAKIRVVYAFATLLSFVMNQMDVNSAQLYEILE